LISFAYFKNKEISLMLLSLFFQGGVFYPTVFNATLFGEFVKGFTATQSGLYLIPLLFGLVLFSIIGTVTLPRFNRYIPFVSSGTAMCIMGLILIAGLNYDSNWGMMIFSGFTVGAGLGFCLQMSVLYLQSLVKEGKEVSDISCMANFSQSIGGGLCLAVLSAIFNGKLTQDFKKLPLKLQVCIILH
jgi:cyanate permease